MRFLHPNLAFLMPTPTFLFHRFPLEASHWALESSLFYGLCLGWLMCSVDNMPDLYINKDRSEESLGASVSGLGWASDLKGFAFRRDSLEKDIAAQRMVQENSFKMQIPGPRHLNHKLCKQAQNSVCSSFLQMSRTLQDQSCDWVIFLLINSKGLIQPE